MNENRTQYPGPKPSPLTAPFWDACSEHRLTIQKCSRCATHVFYPRKRCPNCWFDSLNWISVQGRGTIACFVGAYKPAHPAFVNDAPYIIALVDLSEGPRMLTNIIGVTPNDDLIGRTVSVCFMDRDGVTLPVFQLAEGAA